MYWRRGRGKGRYRRERERRLEGEIGMEHRLITIKSVKPHCSDPSTTN